MNSRLSDLELETLRKSLGRPISREDVAVVEREYTGVGLYVSVTGLLVPGLPDGPYSHADHLEMVGLKHGLVYVVYVEGEKAALLEYVTHGDEQWDGVEREWSFVSMQGSSDSLRGGRAFTLAEVRAMEATLGVGFSEILRSTLTTWPLVGRDLSLGADLDESGLGVELRWMNLKQIVSESTEVYPGLAAICHGFLPVGMCLEGSGDTYFVQVSDRRFVRIPHDAIKDGELVVSRVEQVSSSLERFLTACQPVEGRGEGRVV